jgi:hypothetical protein
MHGAPLRESPKAMSGLTALLALLQVSMIAGCAAVEPRPPDPSGVHGEYGFPAAPSAISLCEQRAYGSGLEITWKAFAVPAAPAELVTFYRERLGSAGFTPEGEGGTWKLPAGAVRPQRVLSILPADADGPHRQCEKSPPAGTRSIVVFSRTVGSVE